MAPGTPSTLISTHISTSFSTQLLPAEANCAVLGQGVWVKKDPGLGLKTVLDIDHGLVLQPRVTGEEILVTLLVRTPDLLVIPKIGQIFLDLNFVG